MFSDLRFSSPTTIILLKPSYPESAITICCSLVGTIVFACKFNLLFYLDKFITAA